MDLAGVDDWQPPPTHVPAPLVPEPLWASWNHQTVPLHTSSHEVRRPEALGALAASWPIDARTAGPCERFSWVSACSSTFAAGSLRAVALRRGARLAAIAPLESKIVDGVEHAAALGMELHEPTDLVYADLPALEGLVEALLASGRPIVLGRVLQTSPTVQAFRRLGPSRAAVFCRAAHPCPVIRLDGTWREPESRLNAGRRSDLRRARRRAADRGQITFEIRTPSIEELEPLLVEAFAVEARSWKGANGTALSCDAERASFFRRYARLACQEGTLRMCNMRIDGLAVAMQLAVECGGSFWLFKVGYDERFAQCAPGLLLMRETLAYAARSGLGTYELMGKIAPWTEVWTREERRCVTLRIYPSNARGVAALGRAAMRSVLQRWK